MKRIIAPFLAALLISSLCACTSTSPIPSTSAGNESNDSLSQSPSPTPDSTPEITPEPNTVLSVGEMTTLGDWEITLDSFEVTDSIPNGQFLKFTPDEGNLYVVTTLTIKNTGTKANTFIKSFAFENTDITSKIMYQEKYEFSSSNLLGHSDELHDASLNPLSSKTGILAYSVVKEAAESDEMILVLTLGKLTARYALK